MKLTKTQIILIGILTVGLLLRLIAMYHVDIEADELVISTRAINFITAGRLSTPDQEALFHYLTDLAYMLFGINPFSSRLMPLVGSMLSILLVYYIANEFFSRKIALVSAFFTAINHYYIRFMIEPDIVAGFFALFSTLLFIKWIKSKKTRLLYGSALMLGLGIMNKPTIILILIAFAYLFLAAIIKGEYKLNQAITRKMIICALIIILCATPVLVYNYLLYKEKGIGDILFTRFLGLNKEPYLGLGGIEDKFSLINLPNGIRNQANSYWRYDPFIFALAIIGFLIFMFRKTKYLFFVLWIGFPFLFIVGSSSVSVHYAIFVPFLCLLAGNAFCFIEERLRGKIRINLFYPLLGLIFIWTIASLLPTLIEPSATIQLRSFGQDIPEDSLVLADSRTYRGILAYAFNDRHYLETNHWLALQDKMDKLAENPQQIETYIIECENDKCGWSDISGINETTELLFSQIKGIPKIKTIKDSKYTYGIYKTVLNLNPEILKIADLTHNFYYFPVGYKNKGQIFDYYEPKTVFDKTINLFAYLMIYAETILAILFMIGLTAYFSIKK